MLSPDGQRVEGWVTGASVLRALARHVTGSQAAAMQAQAAADWEHGDAEAMLAHPPVPLPGYQVIEITVTGDSAAAGRKLGDLRLAGGRDARLGAVRPPPAPAGQRDHPVGRRPGQPADPGTAGRATPAADGGSRDHAASHEASTGSSSP